MKGKFCLKVEFPYLLFILPTFVAYTIFSIYPLFNSFLYAFTNWNGFNVPKFVGIKNFRTTFSDPVMIQALSNTIIYSISVPILVTLFAIPLAVILNSGMKTRNLQRAIFFFPSVPSALIMGYIWSYMLNSSSTGVINQILSFFGVKPILWLATPRLAMLSLIIVSVWGSTGWHACIYLANIQSIPREYYEAATIDGATGFKRFRYITFPMLAPSMTISVMLLLTGSLKVFDLPFSLTSGGPGYATTMVTQIIIARGVTEKLYGQATAMSTVFFFIIFVITALQIIIMKKREENLQ